MPVVGGKICKGCCFKIGFFKKKFTCQICNGHFCTACSDSVKINSDQLREKLSTLWGFNCLKCIVLEYRNIKREHLYLLQNKQLTEFLTTKNISTVACREKYDLIDLVIDYAKTNDFLSPEDQAKEHMHQNHLRNLQQAAHDRRQQEADNNQPSNTTTTTTTDSNQQQDSTTTSSTSEHHGNQRNSNNDGSSTTNPMHHANTFPNFTTTSSSHQDSHSPSSHLSPPNSQANRKWKSMEDVGSVDEIASLSVMELKQVLTANFIDYKGCVEKKELIDKVVMLYDSIQKDKQKTESQSGEIDDAVDGTYEKDICKICMDHTIDCVLLNCGHLVACTKCGKRLAECPICRANVSRVVRIFRV